jgi:hypothetical protein
MHLIVIARAFGETYYTPVCLLGPTLKKSATTYFLVVKNRIKTMDTGVYDFKGTQD